MALVQRFTSTGVLQVPGAFDEISLLTRASPDYAIAEYPSTVSGTGLTYSGTPGTFTWTCPANVYSVSVVCIGGGGAGGAGINVGGGGGGGVGYKQIAVVPSLTYTVVAGAGGATVLSGGTGGSGGDSYFISTSTVKGGGGGGGVSLGGTDNTPGGVGGSFIGDGGGNGGAGGAGVNADMCGAGGGAGGYSGNGGNGAAGAYDVASPGGDPVTGGGGGGGGSNGIDHPYGYGYGAGGGGVGLLGHGTDGSGGAADPGNITAGQGGIGGSGGTNGGPATGSISAYGGNGSGRGGIGGTYGGGGGGGVSGGGAGGNGAVRIIWGQSRTYPNDVTYYGIVDQRLFPDGTFQSYGSFDEVSLNTDNYAVQFNGTNQYLTVPNNAAFNFGSGDFTIEGWFNSSISGGYDRGIYYKRLSYSSVAFGISSQVENKLMVLVSNSTGTAWTVLDNSVSYSPDTLYHFAVTKTNGNVYFYLNGILRSTNPHTTSIYDDGSPVYIGQNAQNSGFWNGTISNIRVVKGTSLYNPTLYPSGFTPTRLLTAVSGTSLLTCQSATIIDNGTANGGAPFTITNVGGAIVSRNFPLSGDTVRKQTTSTYQVYNSFDELSLAYTNTPDKTIINEGDTVTYTINAPLLNNGTGTGTLYYTNTGSMTAANFTGGIVYGVTPLTWAGTATATLWSYTGITQLSTSGFGTGAEFSIRKNNATTAMGTHGVLTVIPTSPGSGYTIGDTITIAGASLGLTTPTNNLTITVGSDWFAQGVYPTTITGTGLGTMTAGNATWTCPDGVYRVSVVCVGGGGGGASGANPGGGGGGALSYIQDIATTPSFLYSVTAGIGAAATGTGGTSSFSLPSATSASLVYPNIVSGTGIVSTGTGTATWTCPAGVTSICIVAVGGGGGGGGTVGQGGAGGGGGGGGLRYYNNFAVTPGNTYAVVAGAGGAAGTVANGYAGFAGGNSSFNSTTLVAGGGAGGTFDQGIAAGGAGSTIGGSIGGANGGNGGQYTETGGGGGGGGGAGGYTSAGGAGGNGGNNGGGPGTSGSSSTDGGGGGGGGGDNNDGASGGGVGIFGAGAGGTGGTFGSFTPNVAATGGGGGSGGASVSTTGIAGGSYGGGGGGLSGVTASAGGVGVVRIIWGEGRSFPNTLTTEILTTYSAGGGSPGTSGTGGAGGTVISGTGFAGGAGGSSVTLGGGGGGAGGYTSAGGAGGTSSGASPNLVSRSGANSTNGGGGGSTGGGAGGLTQTGTANNATTGNGGGGGGVGLLGFSNLGIGGVNLAGTTGAILGQSGFGGSGGATGGAATATVGGAGGAQGGGGGGGTTTGGAGGAGAVRIIWNYPHGFLPEQTALTAVTNTVLLTAQATTALDSSTINNRISDVFGAIISTTIVPFSGTFSYQFNGTTQYLTVPHSSNFVFGSGVDFTIEGWVYTSATTVNKGAFSKRGSGAFSGVQFGTSSTTASRFQILVANAAGTAWTVNDSTVTFAINTWYHFAITKTSGNVYLYINGTLRVTAAHTTAIYDDGTDIQIGRDINASFWVGYLSNFHVVNGTALYSPGTTGNFTPSTTPLTAVTNTKLLTLQSGGIFDNSGINNSITSIPALAGGNTTIPFTSTYSYQFNGTSQFLAIQSSSNFVFGSGVDFTIEGYLYTSATTINKGLYYKRSGSGISGVNFGTSTTTASRFHLRVANADGSAWAINDATAGTFAISTWYHFAITKTNGVIYLYLNGLLIRQYAHTTEIYDDGSVLNIGRDPGGSFWVGYLSNIRVIKGTALYYPPSTIVSRNYPDYPFVVENKGSIPITNGTGTLALTVGQEILQEGVQDIQLQLRSDSTSGTILATAPTVVVADTSRPLALPGGGQCWCAYPDYISGPYLTYTGTPGSFTFTAPKGYTTVSVVCIGGGGSGSENGGGGGGGGALAYIASTAVTAGNTYAVVCGSGGVNGPGGASSFNTSTVIANGGSASSGATGGAGGTVGAGTGFAGGAGGNGAGTYSGGGGGGAGGYTVAGGVGGSATGTYPTLTAGSGAASTSGGAGGSAGGSATAGAYFAVGGGGGGTSPFGSVAVASIAGTSLAGLQASPGRGGGGSGGVATTTAFGVQLGQRGYTATPFPNGANQPPHGGRFGGGGGGGDGNGQINGDGGPGCVRIIWGTGRAYPATLTADRVSGYPAAVGNPTGQQ